jgi:uncharacterized delta-60 repeat protein
MRIQILLLTILMTTSCGIDKDGGSVSLPSGINSGNLDTTFNSNGVLFLDGSAGGSFANDQIRAIAVDSQDRIIAVGSSVNAGANADMTVWRLDSNGALDSSFSGDGIFTHNGAAGGNGDDIAYGLVIDSSDNIYITGTSLNGSADFDMAIWKLTSAGVLDTNFNGTGIFTHDSAAGGNNQDQGNDIVLNGSHLFVTGFSDQTPTNRDMAIWKVSTAGTLDTSFNGSGFFTHDSAAGGEDDNGNALVVDSAGRSYVVGRSDSVANLGDMAIWKISATGLLDTSFNGTGIVTQNGAAGGSGFDEAMDVVFDADGNILLTGYSRNVSGNNDMVLWKYDTSGSLVTSFDDDGMLISDVSSIISTVSNDSGEALLLDSEGRIVVSGNANGDTAVWRFDSTNTLDTAFNTDGFFSHDSAAGGFGTDIGYGIAEDSFNRLYMGGSSENDDGDTDATFWRLQ